MFLFVGWRYNLPRLSRTRRFPFWRVLQALGWTRESVASLRSQRKWDSSGLLKPWTRRVHCICRMPSLLYKSWQDCFQLSTRRSSNSGRRLWAWRIGGFLQRIQRRKQGFLSGTTFFKALWIQVGLEHLANRDKSKHEGCHNQSWHCLHFRSCNNELL